MIFRFFQKLRQTPQFRRRDLFLFLLSLLGLWIAFSSRGHLIDLPCPSAEPPCRRADLLSIDQPASRRWKPHLAEISDWTQNSAAAGTVLFSGAYAVSRVLQTALSPSAALAQWGVDLLLLGQAMGWTAFLNELTRLSVQRPRPYVIRLTENALEISPENPPYVTSPSDYTSFYSGHASFSMTLAVSFLLLLLGRKASWKWWVLGAIPVILSLITGYLRVESGWHYPTDVAVGWSVGIGVAFIVHRFNRQNST